MTSVLSPRVQRSAAIAVLVIVGVVLWDGMIHPLMGWWQGRKEETAQQFRFLAAYRRAAASQAALKRQLELVKTRDVGQSGFLSGDNAELIAAKLQNDIRSKIKAASGQVMSTQVLSSPPDEGFKKIAIRVSFKISTNGLPKVAYEIESSHPDLYLDSLSVRARDDGRASNTNPDPQELTVRWDVFGYMRGRGS